MTITEMQLYAVIVVIMVVVFLIVVAIKHSRKPGPPLAVCPKCGMRSELRKSWVMPVRKTVELTIGIFDCPKCRKAFRRVINKRRIDVGTV